MGEAYSGLLGAYVYGFRRSASWLFRTYVVLSAAIGAYVVLLLMLALVTWFANPTGVIGERALLGVVAIAILAPLFAPVLIVARRYRLAIRPTADRAFALAGFGFVAAVFVGLLIAAPGGADLEGALRPLGGVPRRYGAVPPAVAAILIAALARLTRSRGGVEE